MNLVNLYMCFLYWLKRQHETQYNSSCKKLLERDRKQNDRRAVRYRQLQLNRLYEVRGAMWMLSSTYSAILSDQRKLGLVMTGELVEYVILRRNEIRYFYRELGHFDTEALATIEELSMRAANWEALDDRYFLGRYQPTSADQLMRAYETLFSAIVNLQDIQPKTLADLFPISSE